MYVYKQSYSTEETDMRSGRPPSFSLFTSLCMFSLLILLIITVWQCRRGRNTEGREKQRGKLSRLQKWNKTERQAENRDRGTVSKAAYPAYSMLMRVWVINLMETRFSLKQVLKRPNPLQQTKELSWLWHTLEYVQLIAEYNLNNCNFKSTVSHIHTQTKKVQSLGCNCRIC